VSLSGGITALIAFDVQGELRRALLELVVREHGRRFA
jgi:hypothetical protein